MTTQSGVSYQRKTTSRTAEEDGLTLAKVLKVLLEDGQILASFPGAEGKRGRRESAWYTLTHCLHMRLFATEFCGDRIRTYTDDVINSPR